MSLDFSYSKVRDWKAASTSPYDEHEWHPVGNALVWASIPCGYNQIAAKNIDEVWARIAAYQQICGPLLHFNDGPLFLTRYDIERYVGLSTNASVKTAAEFWKTVVQWAKDHPGYDGSAFQTVADKAKQYHARKAKAAA